MCKRTGFTVDLDVYMLADPDEEGAGSNLTIFDAFTGQTFSNVKYIYWDSTPSAWDPSHGDIVWSWIDQTNGVIYGRMNGDTETTSPVYACDDQGLHYRDWDIRNGLVKKIGPLHL
jgi:hypothetical protein